ncbi:hypothetical protein Pmar_PMAR012804 [Perkinsus marinus ATCC 50983]|uniref:3'-5' exonuclease domain-containing protein n=1 Tax=Perkinsus marinus (strain ATCC 50983 / TXsc) TaxID=423536 RepID=C5M1F4_PERM5|nr:hypothetical protein Pmar_PMAR012804 [Perkinsus marinus ATCC 50983]EEQ97189.1 hypothetical protein Pmar_PMAR012804 [Perkinsus marinus ATCC 50983]|eukprot:XP_002764472.1 hypothetical protein Pmar_PMAR012804 [Perkinsus marinus ATCC 50983]
MKEEETEAMNRLDEAVRKLEGEREEVRGRWEEMESSLRRELENLGEEMMQWKERAEEAEERLREEARKAEVKDEERQVYEEKLEELSQQLSCSGDTTERLMRELEGARLEGNEVRQCLVNQREGYEKTMAQLEENLRDVEGKLVAAEVSVEESRAELAAREEELSREVKERAEAVEGLERQLEEARGKVDELQRAQAEEEEKYSVLAQTNERHIASLERQIEQARVGYEKHIDEMNKHLLEIQSDHEVEIARIGKEAIIEHDELIEAYNARIAQLQEEIDEKDAKIETLSKEATVLVETLKDAARDEAAQISEEYEGKMEDLERELGRVRAELEEVQREGEGRLERAMAEFEEMLRQKEAEYRQELQRMEEAEKARLEEEKEGELVRGELQKTIARLFEEKEELVEFEDAIDNLFGRVDEAFKIKDIAEHKIVGDATRDGAGLDGGLRREAEVQELSWRPQDNFKELVDNYRPRFVPRLRVKHNSELPVPKAILDAQNGVVSTDPLPHAYAEEIRTWQEMADAEVDGVVEAPSPQLPNKEAELMWVDTVELVDEMLDELAEAREVAIDLEHHNMQSYRGFTCLIQIATRKKDYIVDVLAPGIMMKMHDFNRITSDPGIVKVLHGADMDVQWLQRDLSAYLCNMFDTGQAARVLELGGGYSLKNLLDFYCGYKADKANQLADWRQRPLSERMKQYARDDVHYLL